MRWLLALIVVTSVAGCRRSTPEAPAESAPAPAEPAAPAVPAAESAAAAAAAPEQGAAAASSPPAEESAKVVDAAPPAPAPANPAPAPADDDAIYTWTDADGVAQFGSVDDIPDELRRSARKVSGGVTVMEVAPPPMLLTAPPADAPAPATDDARAAAQRADPAARPPGDRPELDADGLPIPGTMKDTAHTRAVRQATGIQLDPAAVEREYQKQLRDLNCKEKDGAMICG